MPGTLPSVSWELALGIAMVIAAAVAVATIVLLLVFGARKDGQKNDDVQAELERRAATRGR
jgi:hypothetical protein